MGMTIDEAIKIVRTMHYPTNGDNEKERDTAIMLLLDTTKKYQKIKEILNDDSYYEDYGSKAESFIVSAISEVIEDGKA